MSAESGGGGSGAGFFLAFAAVVIVAWFYAGLEKARMKPSPQEPQTAAVLESESLPSPTTRKKAATPLPPPSDHGVTYYLDEDGNILDVVHF